MERLCNIAYNRDTEFLLFGGDLIDGYTVSPEDYNMQFNAWKQAVSAYRRSKSIYTIMGNHECLSNNYITGKKYGLSVDKWPYDTMSSEVLFARNFVNPTNGPKQEHKGRPSYTESVYSYQYGNVKFVCLNNNYWVSYLPHKTGGSPEGYFFQDQIKWLERQLEAAEDDRSVDHIIISMHEPMFPNGGHITDTMWYLGDNKWRGHTYDHEKGKLVPEQKGIIEVRNQIAKMVTNSSKVAVVLGSDEHSYSRLLIDENTPCGNLETDDKNGDNFLSWPDEQVRQSRISGSPLGLLPAVVQVHLTMPKR
ncbi:MAG: metallophosphoesterase [Planctomycetota bacterium]|nr:metallophosphoesterase [Planctomycetota bacterium]